MILRPAACFPDFLLCEIEAVHLEVDLDDERDPVSRAVSSYSTTGSVHAYESWESNSRI